MTRYYLDTTAQIERHAGDPERRKIVQDLLRGEKHATSSHVRREWKGIVEDCAVDVLNACKKAETIGDVFAQLGSGFFRKPGQRLRVLAILAGGDFPPSVDELEIRTRTFLRSEADALFCAGIDEVRDASVCSLSRERAAAQPNGRWSITTSCRKAECVCDHDEFVAANSAGLTEGAQALKASDDQKHRNMGTNTLKVLASEDPLVAKGANCHQGKGPGGDLTIALECGDDETLLTTDHSFDIICPALNKRHLRFAHTPEP